MSMKTVLIQLMKLLPKSFELQRAIAADETIKTKVDSNMFRIKDETNWKDVEEANVTPAEAPSAEEAAEADRRLSQ